MQPYYPYSHNHRQQQQQLHHQQLHLTKQPQNDDGERYLHGVRRWLHGAGGGMGTRGIARSGVGEATEEGECQTETNYKTNFKLSISNFASNRSQSKRFTLKMPDEIPRDFAISQRFYKFTNLSDLFLNSNYK